MPSAQHRQQMVQLVSIADARTRRALAAVAAAQQLLDAARYTLQQRSEDVNAAEQSIVAAEKEIRRDPANEQHRLWLGKCQLRRDTARAARDDAQELCDNAAADLANAQKACQRQQVRQNHVEGAAQQVKRDAMREAERRIEDDQQGSGRPVAAAGQFL